jgi:hypothetical protein
MKNNTVKPGMTLEWLDQGPALILGTCLIQDPIPEESIDLIDLDANWETGWTIKLVETGEVLDVHEETLEVKHEAR